MLNKTPSCVTAFLAVWLFAVIGYAAGPRVAGDTAAPPPVASSEDPAPSEAPGAAGQVPADPGSRSGAEQATGTGGDGARVVQLKALEQRVNELKERIFRSKARLNLLKETVLHGVIAGSRATIKHRNDMGGTFRLVKLVYAVDGRQIFSKTDDDGGLDDPREFDVFNGSIVPGSHTVSVMMVFRGHGYGVFTYLKGYRFTVRASHTFTSAEGRQNVITVRAYEKGNATTELKDRPAIAFEASLYGVQEQGAK